GFLGYRLRQYCAPEKAFGWHASQGSDGADASLRNAGEETVALYEGVAAALALITLGGLRGDLDGRWLPFWQAWVRRTLRAQVASCGLDTTLVPEKRSDDGCTLAPYLELAAATDMAAMSIAGLLGFSDRQRELIDPARAVLPALSSLIRLAADMAFDPVEPVNCAIYLCAAETGASLRDARSRLARAPEEAITIEGRLIALTHSRLARFEERCRRSTPGVSALGRVVRKAVLAEIETVESGHGRSRRSRFFPAPECNLAGELFDPFFALHRVV
ncbi:MAG: hypothetical protein MI919_07435, partial [Holophagales bacterium]|nr:hypothetical protein [Holophagales bacterium]